MDDISSLDIRRFKKKILETQRATTWNRYRNILNAVFNRGIEWEMCARNPVAPVKRESDTRVREFLSEDQADALLREAKKDSFFLYALVLTALKTGRRLSELLHLEWRYVDFEKGRIMFMISKKKGGSEEFYQLPPRIVFQTLSLLKNVNDEKPFPYFPRREWRKVRDNIEKTSGFWTSVSTGLGIDALRR
ncbi:MAG TPA: site-specific integrase [bacterium]|nr:site-specific integrase [bacterium]HPN93453.1 site-specific integrase [bacterium]